MEELLTKKDVLRILGISMPTLDIMIRDKKIPYYKVGETRSSRVRFRAKDVEKYIKSKIIK